MNEPAHLPRLADDVVVQPCAVPAAPDAVHVVVSDPATGVSAATLALSLADVPRAYVEARCRLQRHLRLAREGR